MTTIETSKKAAAAWVVAGELLRARDRRALRQRLIAPPTEDLPQKDRFTLRTLDALVPPDDHEQLDPALEVWRWLDDLGMCEDADQAYNNLVDVIIMGPLTAGEILILLLFAGTLPRSEDTDYSRQALRSLARLRRAAPHLAGDPASEVDMDHAAGNGSPNRARAG